MHAYLDTGVLFAKCGQGREESVNGTLVHSQGEFAAAQSFQFGEAFFDFVTEIDQAFGVVLQKCSRIGEANRAGASDEERLAKGVLQLADGQADGGLSAIQA